MHILATFSLVVPVLLLSSTGQVSSNKGTYLGSFKNYAHGIAGDVYALDEHRLHIVGFSYDGQGPDAFFYGGTSNKPNGAGIILEDDLKSQLPLKRYESKDITITLPKELPVSKLKWLSVWCRQFAVNFGDVVLDAPVQLPQIKGTETISSRNDELGADEEPSVLSIGPLVTLGHGVSGDVIVFDDRTIVIDKFKYDGQGPAAYFWADYEDRLTAGGQLLGSSLTTEPGVRLPRADGSQMVIVKIPEGRTVNDYSVFGVWCTEAATSFGEIQFPEYGLNVPKAKTSEGAKKKSKLNCEVLDEESAFEVRWALTDNHIVMQLVGKVGEGNYMSFGLSGNEEKSEMVGGDVVIAWVDDKGQGHAEDYHLASKESCSNSRGVCPDEVFNMENNVDLLNSAVVNGFHMVTVKRPLFKQDEQGDKHIYVDGPQAIIWAIGRMSPDQLVTYHFKKRNNNTIMVDFARNPTWNCPEPDSNAGSTSPQTSQAAAIRPRPTPKVDVKKDLEPWVIPKFTCPRRNRFRARIGPSGGQRGYEAITGNVGWGIAWYLNGILIPEITLQRGRTYIFDVEGGNDPENSAKSHPFYITSSNVGGYANADENQKRNEIIFAGAEYNTATRKYEATAAGRLCEFTHNGNKRTEDYENYGDFKRDLRIKCGLGKASILEWTPNADTPDTVYYQCFTHRRLGYKINIVDSCSDLRGSASIQSVKNVSKSQDLEEKVKKQFGEKNNPKESYSKPAELPRPIVRTRPTQSAPNENREPKPIVVEEVLKSDENVNKELPPKRTIYVPVKIVPEHELPENIPIHDGSDKPFIFGNPIAVPLGPSPPKQASKTTSSSNKFSYEGGFKPLILRDQSKITQPIGQQFDERPLQGSESIPQNNFKPPTGLEKFSPVKHSEGVPFRTKGPINGFSSSHEPHHSIRPQSSKPLVEVNKEKLRPNIISRPHLENQARPEFQQSQHGSDQINYQPRPQYQDNHPRPQITQHKDIQPDIDHVRSHDIPSTHHVGPNVHDHHQERPRPPIHRFKQPSANFEETFNPVRQSSQQHYQVNHKVRKPQHHRFTFKKHTLYPQKQEVIQVVDNDEGDRFKPIETKQSIRPVHQYQRPRFPNTHRNQQHAVRRQQFPQKIHHAPSINSETPKSSEYAVLSHVMEYINEGQRRQGHTA